MSGSMRRFLQLRLASVLILMSLAAAGFAIRYQLLEPIYRQQTAQKALAAIVDSTTRVPADYAWQRSYFELEHTTVFNAQLGDASLDLLDRVGDLPRLEELSLESTGATDRTAFQIGRLRHLRKLQLANTHITNKGFASIANCENLTELLLYNTLITDDGLTSITSLQKLESLSLPIGVCGSGLESVAKLANLRELNLSESSVLTKNLALLAGSPVKHLSLPGYEPLHGRVWLSLSKLPNLEEVEASLSRAFCAVSNEHVRHLCRCKNLKQLTISGSKLNDDSMKMLTKLPRLHTLQICGNLTDTSLEYAAEMKALSTLVITGRFTDAARKTLKQRKPKLKLKTSTLVPTSTDDSFHLVRVSPFQQGYTQSANGRTMSSTVLAPGAITIQWPAKLSDLLFMIEDTPGEHIPFTHASSINFVGPPYAYRHPGDFEHKWDLSGLHKLKNLKTVFYFGTVMDSKHKELTATYKAEGLKVPRISKGLLTRYHTGPITLPNKREVSGSQHGVSVGGYSNVDQAMVKDIAERFKQFELSNLILRCVDNADLAPLSKAENLRELKLCDEPSRELLSEWRLSKPLPQVERLYCSSNSMTNAQMEFLPLMPQLKRVELYNPRVTTEGLLHLKHLRSLSYLGFDHAQPVVYGRVSTSILPRRQTIRDLSPIADCVHLETLSLKGQNLINPRSYSELKRLKRLEYIILTDAGVTDEICEHLSNCTSLKQVELGQSPQVTDDGIKHLASLPNLEYLDVRSDALSDNSLVSLARCLSLKSLKISSQRITTLGRDTLRQTRPELQAYDPGTRY